MKLTMQLKSRSYDIILKAGCLANLHQFTNVANRKVFVLTDSGVPAEYAQTVAAQCPDSTIYTIPQGEGSKCLKVYGQVLQAMLAVGMDRKDLLVAQSDIFVTLPGGVGTLDEIFTVVAAHTIGYHNKRVIVYDLKGFWGKLIELLDDMQERGFVRGSWHDYIDVAHSLDDIAKLCVG